ncbi:MAG: hypothetical protein QM831_09750 [Kofleriaceae bacterium]
MTVVGSATSKSYTGGHFELAIDGHKTTAYLKSLEGGFIHAATMDEKIGPDNNSIKHTSVASIDPINVEFGISGANDMLLWIQQSWRKAFNRRNGEARHANFNLDQVFTHEFYDALIQETTFPALDGGSKDAAYIKCKIQPEHVIIKQERGAKLQPNLGAKQKLWMCSGFRLTIDDFEEATRYTNKIEAFTIKQGIKSNYYGSERFPQIEPTKIDFPSLTCTLSLGYADKIIKWYDDAVVKGTNEAKKLRTGTLEFLAPDRSSTLFRINLYDVGIAHMQIPQSVANADGIKRIKYELYVGRMDLDGKGMGLE